MAATLQIDERHEKAPARLNLVAIKIQLLSKICNYQLFFRSNLLLQKPTKKICPRSKIPLAKTRIVTFESAPWTTMPKIVTSKKR